MSGVVTLDLDELAQEWSDASDVLESPRGEPLYTQDEIDEAQEIHDKCVELCGELGITPVEPDTLRWYNRENNPTLIREDTFEEYAQEFAEDVHGDGVREMSSFIDWEKFADGLRIDYYSIEYNGHTWLRRA